MSAPRDAYSKVQIFQFLGAFAAITAVGLTTIFTHTQTPPPPLGSDFNLWAVIVGTGIVMPLLLWFDVKVHNIRVIFYTVMHILAAMMMLFYIGSYNPMGALWLILCTVTYIEFGRYSFMLSSSLLIFSAVLFCILIQPLTDDSFRLGEYFFYSMVFNFALIATAYTMTKIIDRSDLRRRELEEMRRSEMAQLNKVNVLLNSMTDTILTLDIDGRVTSENAAALSFFDTNATLIGRKIGEVLSIKNEENESIDVKKMIDNVERSQTREDAIVGDEEVGKMHLSIQMSPIYDGNKKQGIVMAIRDITKQKTLEDEKDEFISVASHELRTPIAVAEASLSNLVLMQEKGIEEEKLKAAAEMAHDEVVYLAGVVNDLSTLSRAERGVADTPEPIDVDELMHTLFRRYEPEAVKHSLALNLDIKGKLPIVEVSRLYLEEMLQNFITNAIKYTKEGSVTLMAEEVTGGVRCSIKDTGIGISKSDQRHLGERFFRSEDFRTRETNGTGLGLYVVDKLADKIGTKVEVESRLNQGSTFSVVIPLKSSTHATGRRSTLPLPES